MKEVGIIYWTGLVMTGITYFGIAHEVLLIYIGLIVIDTIFGIYSSYKNGNPPTSKALSDGIVKKATRILLPFILSITGKGSSMDEAYLMGFVTTIMSILIVGEGYSIIRHIYNINTGKDLPEIDVLEIVVQRFTSTFKISNSPKGDTAQG